MEGHTFSIHHEKSIGCKKLTKADLGESYSSNQTHIGLSQKVFTYMSINEEYESSILLYEGNKYKLTCYVDKIVREESIGASKIRRGYNYSSIVDKIRLIASSIPMTTWYLVWFGRNDGTPMFWLIREGSEDYKLMARFLESKMIVYNDYSYLYRHILKIIIEKFS